jgi:lipoyl-dependent peroxiredoxin
MATFSRRAELQWEGDLMSGAGDVRAGSGAFAVPVRFPSVVGDPPGKTTPEELLAASHAACYGIGLRSLIAVRGGQAQRVTVAATVRAEKGPNGIRIRSSHLSGTIKGLKKLDEVQLREIAREVAEECTISLVLRGAVQITHEVRTE